MVDQLAAQFGVSPDWVALVLALLPVVLGVLHSRGNKLPILSAIIEALTKKPAPAPVQAVGAVGAVGPDPLSPVLLRPDEAIHQKLDELLRRTAEERPMPVMKYPREFPPSEA